MPVMIEEAIVHVGMHKTGSSSIQDTFSKISMEEIQYLSLGSYNHSGFLATLLSDNPENYHSHARNARTTIQVQALKESYTQQLHDALKKTKKSRILISAEYLSKPKGGKDELTYLKNLLLAYCKRIRVIGYVRPPVGYMQSSFQQRLKGGRTHTFDLHSGYPYYHKRFSIIDDVFGKDNVDLVAFRKDSLHNGDVVQDFANRIGVALSPEKIVRTNESLSLEATALLYTFRRFESTSSGYKGFNKDNKILIEALATLKGQKLSFTESAVGSVLKNNQKDIDWMSERLGISILDEPSASDQAISSEEDLFKVADANRMTVWKLLKQSTPLTRGSKGLSQLVDWLHALRARDIPTLQSPEHTLFTSAQLKALLATDGAPASVLNTLAEAFAKNGQHTAARSVRIASKRAANLLDKSGHNNGTTLQKTVHGKG